MKKRILIATYPFGQCGDKPIKLLEENKEFEIIYNPLGRRLKENEVGDMIVDMDAIIAGTEPYTKQSLDKANKLRVISRVGVGLDNVDFDACEKKEIIVTYTPEAPADGVADLTIAQIINLLRGIYVSDNLIREKKWERTIGKLVEESKIGILGVGRIGKRVIRRLQSYNSKIYACDIKPDYNFGIENKIEWVNKEQLFKMCDIITIHIPMNQLNYHCIGFNELSNMKSGSFIINTSRGSVVDENALISLLQNKHLGGAALDVFEKEPNVGELVNFDNVILTAHIGSSTNKSRYLMELGATIDCIKVLKGEKPENIVTSNCF